MGNAQSSKKHGSDLGPPGTPNKKRSSFRESLRSLTKRKQEPEEEEPRGPKVELELPVENYSFPFENVVFEGGGTKGLAYCGAVRTLEEVGIWNRIRRLAGASAGSLTAALLAVGYNSYQLERYIGGDLNHFFNDHRCGCCSFLPNVWKKFGWNPAQKIYKWLGVRLKEATGNADVTFAQVQEMFGRELCIVVTNLTQMTTEYCHPKTTPDMAVRLAVRMSMAMPVMFEPVKHTTHGFTDYYVDGGLLCNYPIHCFDGWWLSLRPQDSFLEGLQPLTDLPKHLDPERRFGGFNDRTMGFLLYSDREQEVFKAMLEERNAYREKVVIPETRLSKYKQKMKGIQDYPKDKHTQLSGALKHLVKTFKDQNITASTKLSVADLENILSKRTELSDSDLRALFGADIGASAIFAAAGRNSGEQLLAADLVRYVDRCGMNYEARYLGYRRCHITDLTTFLDALKETLSTSAKRAYVKKHDMDRTVGINTRYVDTLDLGLEKEDKKFLIEQGKMATKDFLEYYVVQKLPPVNDNDSLKSFSRDELSHILDDDLSEIIDHRDYMEDFFGKI